MYRLLTLTLSLIVLTCITACSRADTTTADKTPSEPPASVPDVPFSMTLEQDGADGFIFTVDLNSPQPALFFSRSRNDYRMETYEAISEGARLERVGEFDTIIFEPSVLQARFRVTPATDPLPGTYTPYVPFSNGGQAVFLGAFELLRAESVEAIRALNDDLDAWDGEQFDIPLTLKTSDRILLGGDVLDGTAKVVINGSGNYAYLGPGAPVQGASFAGMMDPGMPDWLSAGFDGELSQIFKALETRFGRSLEDKASVLFAFRGYGPDQLSNTGGVLPGGQMILEMSGKMFETPNDRLKGYIQWFLTHEAAHLFQQSGSEVGYADRSDSWLGEGHANAAAHIILSELGTVPEDVIQRRYAQGYAFCVESMQGASMAEITARNDQSHYDCGDFLWRIVDAALPEQAIFALWDGLRARAKTAEGAKFGEYDTQDFYELLTDRGIDPALLSELQAFIDGPNEDAAQALQDIMDDVGIKAKIKSGELQSIVFP